MTTLRDFGGSSARWGLALTALCACTAREPSEPGDPGTLVEELSRGPNAVDPRLHGRELPRARPFGRPEPVALFFGAMPTGVTVSASGRIFVNFPRWGDPVPFTVGEVVGGTAVPYPNEDINAWRAGDAETRFVSVQSVVVDPNDRLWVLDTGSVEMQPPIPGGAKLVGIDLSTDQVVKTIVFAPDVVLPSSYLNDVRFDLRRSTAGMAFITDSSATGPNGFIVVDLDSGAAFRKLGTHESVQPEPGFLAIVEGRPVYETPNGEPPHSIRSGSDGIAIANDGSKLLYSPLASRRLYSVSLDAVASAESSDDDVADTVEDLGEKGASDGLESDAEGRVYATNYEHNAIQRRTTDGLWQPVVADPRLLWPDTLSLKNGYLYFTANQLHRQPRYHEGQDERQKPYVLFRVPIDATPVALR
jgi:sugar lactone lactonase YvrE